MCASWVTRHTSIRHSNSCYTRMCGKNLNIVLMCAVSPVMHTSNISSCQKKTFSVFPWLWKIPLRWVLWFSWYKCLWSWRTLLNTLYNAGGPQIFQKARWHLQILGVRRVTWNWILNWGITVLKWPVNFTVIWYILLIACELIQNFVCKKRNCNNYTDTNATVQNLLAQDLCTPVVLHSCYSVIIHYHKKFKSLYKHVDICLTTVAIVWLLFCTRICLITRF